MQEKCARSLEVFIRCGGRGAAAGSVSSGDLEGRTQAHRVCCISFSRLEVIIGCYSLVSETLWKGGNREWGYSAAQHQFYFCGAAGGDSKY